MMIFGDMGCKSFVSAVSSFCTLPHKGHLLPNHCTAQASWASIETAIAPARRIKLKPPSVQFCCWFMVERLTYDRHRASLR